VAHVQPSILVKHAIQDTIYLLVAYFVKYHPHQAPAGRVQLHQVVVAPLVVALVAKARAALVVVRVLAVAQVVQKVLATPMAMIKMMKSMFITTPISLITMTLILHLAMDGIGGTTTAMVVTWISGINMAGIDLGMVEIRVIGFTETALAGIMISGMVTKVGEMMNTSLISFMVGAMMDGIKTSGGAVGIKMLFSSNFGLNKTML
jgi:hypothetical protein